MTGIKKRLGSLLGPEGRSPQLIEGTTTQLGPHEPAKISLTKIREAQYRVDAQVPRGLGGDPSAVADFGEALASEINTSGSPGRNSMASHFENRRTIDPSMYDTIGDAVADMRDGDILMLDQDYTLTGQLRFPQDNITVDGRGYELAYDGPDNQSMLWFDGDNIVLKDITLDGRNQCFYGVRLYGDGAYVSHVRGGWSRFKFIGVTHSSHHIIEHVHVTEPGWDAVSLNGFCDNVIVRDCVAVRSGRHGFSTDGGSDTDDMGCTNITFERCTVIDNGDTVLNEGQTSFHFERSPHCRLINCVSKYTPQHPKNFAVGYGNGIPGVRVQYAPHTVIDGLTVLIEAGYRPLIGRIGSWLYVQQDNPEDQVIVRNMKVINESDVVTDAFLNAGDITITDSEVHGLVTARQVSTLMERLTLENNVFNGVAGHSFLHDVPYALRLMARNNVVRDYDFLAHGAIEYGVIENNRFVNSGDIHFGHNSDWTGRSPRHNTIRNNLYNAPSVAHVVVPQVYSNTPQATYENNVYTGGIDVVLQGETAGEGDVVWRGARRIQSQIGQESTAHTRLDRDLLSYDHEYEIDLVSSRIISGRLRPENNVEASPGTIYLYGGASAPFLYVKESGTGSTGWVAK